MRGNDGNNGTQMARSEPPHVKVSEPIALCFDSLTNAVHYLSGRCHVEQNSACIAEQPIGPACNYEGPHNPRQRIHPEPTEQAGERQAHNNEEGNRSVRHNMNDGRAHIVVAVGYALLKMVVVIVPVLVAMMSPAQ